MAKDKITCIGLLFLGCGISYFSLNATHNIKDKLNNYNKINNYFERTEIDNNYIAILEIPRINLKRGLYAIDNPLNDINKNIVFLDSSDMPNKNNSRVIVVGHSGSTYNAYFKDLYKLKLNDFVIMYYENNKYTYKIRDKYEIVKTGTMAIEPNKDKSTLTLVTCKGNDKQIVIIGELIK